MYWWKARAMCESESVTGGRHLSGRTFEWDVFLNPDDHADRDIRTLSAVSKIHHPKRQNMAAVTELPSISHHHPPSPVPPRRCCHELSLFWHQ